MIRRPLTASLLVALGLLAGYGLGGFFPHRETVATGSESGRARPSGLSALVPATAPLSPVSEEKIDAVWRGRTPSQQMALAAAWAEVRDPETIRGLLANLHRLPAHSAQTAAQAMLLNNWLAVEPEAALAWCRGNAENHVAPMVESWAEKDVTAARAYALSLGDNTDLDTTAAAVLKVLSRRNPDEAYAFLDELGTRGENLYRVGQALTTLAREDPRALLAHAEGLPSSLRKSCREAATKALATADPTAALVWWEQQPDRRSFDDSLLRALPPEAWEDALAVLARLGPEAAGDYTSVLTYTWGNQDPARAFALLTGLDGKGDSPLGILAEGQLGSLLGQWSEKDAPAAAAAFLTLENPDADSARNIGLALRKDDPAAARAWAEAIQGESIRANVLEALQSEGTEIPLTLPPASAAEAVARALSDTGGLRENDLRGLPVDERDRIAAAIVALPPAEATRAAMGILANRDALSFATTGALLGALRPEDEASVQQVQNETTRLAGEWANQIPSDAARWAGTLPAGSTLNAATTQIARTWQNYDREAARAWVDSLADDAAREAGLKALGIGPFSNLPDF